MKIVDFFNAIQQGNTDVVLEGLRSGYIADTTNESGDSALDLALEMGHSEIADLLMNSPSTQLQGDPEFSFSFASKRQDIGASVLSQSEPIAIVGMSCRFAGDADSLNNFWQSLMNQSDTVSTVPVSRFITKSDFIEAKKYPAAFLKNDISLFDAGLFRIGADEAALMDPQQRMLLEAVYHAFEQGCFDLHSLSGKQVGVYVGQMTHDYMDMMRSDSNDGNGRMATGNIGSVLSGRISYLYNFLGEALTLNTACSSSLAGVHIAANSLRSGQVDMALVAGVNAIIDPRLMSTADKAGMTSKDGRCKAFSQDANGYGRGEGVGVVLLKRLSDAVRDNDNILALVCGSALNQDGQSSQLTAPQKSQQVAVIKDALRVSGLCADDIDLVEAHGTGTIIGDQIETGALSQVFGQRQTNNRLVVRSVKSNIGHCEAAAGVAGLIKTVLSLQHGQIPGQAWLGELSEKVDSSSLRIDSLMIPWPKNETRPRRAGISGFGFSGTNAHLIIEEAPHTVLDITARLRQQWQDLPEYKVPQQATPVATSQLLVLSARSKEALASLINRYENWLQDGSWSREDLANLSYTSSVGRTHQPHRMVIAFDGIEDLIDQLAQPKQTAFGEQYCLTNLSEKQFEAMVQWYKRDVYLQSIVSDQLPVETFTSINHAPLSLSVRQKILYAFVLLYAAAKRYQDVGLTLSALETSGIGDHVQAVLVGKKTMSAVMADILAGNIIMSGPSELESQPNIGDGYDVFLKACASHYQHGKTVDWFNFWKGYICHKIALPLYPFQQQRYWYDSVLAIRPSTAHYSTRNHPGLVHLAGGELVYEHRLDLNEDSTSYLSGHRVNGKVVFSAAGYLGMIMRAVIPFKRQASINIKSVQFKEPLFLSDSVVTICQLRLKPVVNHNDAFMIEIYAWKEEEDIDMAICHVVAEMELVSAVVQESIDLTQYRSLHRTSGSVNVYARLEGLGLSYAIDWRLVEYGVVLDNNQSFICMGTQRLEDDGAKNVITLDAALHSTILLIDTSELAQGTGLVPKKINNLVISGDISRTAFVLAERDVTRNGLDFTLRFVDKTGHILAEVKQYTAAKIAVDLLYNQVLADSCFQVEWPMHELTHSLSSISHFRQTPDFVNFDVSLPDASELPRKNKAWLYQYGLYIFKELLVTHWPSLQVEGSKVDMSQVETGKQPEKHFATLLRKGFDYLAKQQIVRLNHNTATVLTALPSHAELLKERTAMQVDEQDIQAVFLESVIRDIERIIHGELDALKALFPEDVDADSYRHAAAIYQHANDAHLANYVTARMLDSLRAYSGEKPIRILEIGAGTGGTTRSLVPVLKKFNSVQYVYSDISPSFARNVDECFADSQIVYRFAVLDISRNPAEQGFAAEQFDIIIATNVLHATQNLPQTLAHVQQLLVKGGLSIISETIEDEPWLDLTFGLTPGWWAFNDSIRTNSPLLPKSQWELLLNDAGMSCQYSQGDSQRVFLACSQSGPRPLKTQLPNNFVLSFKIVVANMVAECLLRHGLGSEVCDMSNLNSLEQITLRMQQSENPTLFYIADKMDLDGEGMAAYQARVAQPFLRLLQALHGKKSSINLVTLQSRALDDLAILHPEQATLSGFLTSAAGENKQWQIKSLDCTQDFWSHDTFVDKVVKLGLQNTPEQEFIVRNNHIFVPRLCEKPELMTVHSMPPNSFGVILITGGTGEIGQALVAHLRKQGHQNFALLSRCESSGSSMGREHGVVVYQDDLTDLDKLSKTWNKVAEQLGPITSVYHLAGTLDDRTLKDMSWEAVHAVFKSKVIGAYHLHQLTLTRPVESFVLFSSVASLLSTAGQMNHVAANRYMDSLAHARRGMGLPAVSINWGFWSQIGSAARINADVLGKRKGFLSLTPKQCFKALEHLKFSNPSQVVVAKFDWSVFFSQFSKETVPVLFKKIAQSYTSALTYAEQHALTQFDWNAFVQQYASPKDQQKALATMILELLCQQLLVNHDLDIPTDSPLNAFPVNIDSLAEKAVVESLNEKFSWQGMDAITTNIFFSHESIDAIAVTIWQQLRKGKTIVTEGASQKIKNLTPLSNSDTKSISSNTPNDTVAIIGMSLRFPGANTAEEYWQALTSGEDLIISPKLNRSGEKCYFGHLETEKAKKAEAALLATDISHFDAAFFRISAEEATVMDPQQRLLLMLVWEALEQAGIAPSSLKGSNASVVFGIAANEFGDLLLQHSEEDNLSRYHASGNNPSATAGRISYQLGLQGPNMTINTACSSSLVALDTACRHIKEGIADLAITGAVNLILSPSQMRLYQSNGMLSPTRHCHTFSDKADGMVRAEGCAVYILKSLHKALLDGDNILAVVEGTAVNQNGTSFSFMTPDMNAQRALIRQSLRATKVDPAHIDWVETHGTGTQLGDPVEVEAICSELGISGRQLPLGAVKSNLGHAEAAAGAAGLSKLILAFQNQIIPPNRFAGNLNPQLQPYSGYVEPVTSAMSWARSDGRTRRAALSSFGFSGTNGQAIISEAPKNEIEPIIRLQHQWQMLQDFNPAWRKLAYPEAITPSKYRLIVISAKTENALREQLRNLQSWLENNLRSWASDLLERIAMTLSKGRDHFQFRVVLVASNQIEMHESISKLLEKSEFLPVQKVSHRLAFMFTGQGSQYENMGKDLYQSNLLYRSIFDYCEKLLKAHLDADLSAILFGARAKEYLSQTSYAQPALFVLEYALASLLIAYGMIPEYVLGHSVGEYVAATLAGCMSLDDSLKLICARGRIMEKAPEGKMLAVAIDAETTQDILIQNGIELDIAGKNHQNQTILSGTVDAADRGARIFKDKKIKVTELSVKKAFHSRCMAPVLDEFYETASQLTYYKPEAFTFISTLTGHKITEPLNAEHWVDHLRQGVDFIGAVNTMDALGVSQCCEIGAKSVLISMVKTIFEKKASAIIWYDTLTNRKPDSLQLLAMLGHFYESGGMINWYPFWIGSTVKPIDLPKYAFQCQSYWPTVLGGSLHPFIAKPTDVADDVISVDIWNLAQQTVATCLNLALPQKDARSLDYSFAEYGGTSIELSTFQEALYNATAMTFTMKDLEELSLRKIALCLPESFKAAELKIAVPDVASWYKPFPLNPIQYAYWIGRQGIIPLGHVSAHGYLEVKMTQIDVSRLQATLHQMIQQHLMLRVTVNRQGIQCVQEHVPEYQIPFVDLSMQTEIVKQQRMLAIRDELSHQVKDASVWPLFDIRVTKVSNEFHLLHLSFDSLVVDMYSMRLLFDEWYQRYTNPSYTVSPLTFTFRDYHEAIGALKQQEQYQKAQAYWQERVKTMPLGPDLPLLIEPAQVKKQSFARCNAVLPEHKWDAIKEKANERNITPTTVLLTLFAIVLGRYSRRKEFLINLTLFRRNHVHPEVKQLLGDFTNVEVFSTNVTQSHTAGFSDLVKESKDRLLVDLDHADFNGVDVQRALAAHRKLEGGEFIAPIVFTSLLNLKLSRDSDQQAGDSVWQKFGEVIYSITQTPQIWLDHKTFESSEGLVVEWDYVEELFDEELMRQMHADYIKYLEYLSQANWEQPLPDIVTQRLIPVMETLNQTSVPEYVTSQTLVSLMSEKALKSPNNRAVFDSLVALNYREFDDYTTKVAAALQALGVIKGDFVGISLDRSVNMMIAIVATLKAGAVYLPIETSLPEKRKKYVLNNSQAKVVLTDAAHHSEWSSEETNVVLIEDAKQSLESLLHVSIEPHDLAYVVYTSGSSGDPKGAMIEHRSVVNRLLWMQKDYNVHAGDVFIQKTPVSFDVSIWELFLPLISGSSLFMPRPEGHKDISYLRDVMQLHGITLAHFVPSMLEIFLQSKQSVSLPELKTVFCSGEALLPDQVNKFNKLYPQVDLVNFYGPTEAAVDVTYWVAPKTLVTEVPIGKPAANVEIIILDNMGLLCPVGVPGELLLAGVQVGLGYLGLPDKTAQSFVTNPYYFSEAGMRAYRTGDLAYLNKNGQVIYLGRMDDQIKIRGQRIELGEVQESVNGLPMVQQSAVLPIKDERCQTSLMAFVVLDKVPTKEHIDKILFGAIVDPNERNAFTVNNESCLTSARSTTTIALFAEGGLEEGLFKRKSYRNFAGDRMTPNTLINWLNAEPQINEIEPFSLSAFLKTLAAFKNDNLVIPKYPYPSAGSLYPVKCYLAIGDNEHGIMPGYYYFDQVRHRLELCAQCDTEIEPGIHLALVAHKRMMEPMYGAFWQDFAAIEAGTMLALLSRKCESMQASLTKDESLQWVTHLDFFQESDVICGLWRLKQNAVHMKRPITSNLPMWFYVSEKVPGLKPGLYHRDGDDLIHTVDSYFPLHLLSVGDNARVVAQSSVVAFFTAKSSLKEATMAIGSQLMTWMETGVEHQIGVCPMGTCPIPKVYADIIGSSVVLAVAIGPLSKQQIEAIETSQASGSLKTIESYLSEQLRYTALIEAMYPERFIVVENIPTTDNGKLDRRVLLEIAQKNGSELRGSFVQPRTKLELDIYSIWQEKEVLQGRNFGVHDSFKSAGGNSMTQNTISLRLQEQFNVPFSNADVFTYSTIAKQAELIDLREDDELKTNASFALATMVVKGNLKLIEALLVKNKVDINQQDARGRTALYIAAYCGRRDIVALLLKYKARVDIAKNSGVKPISCAVRNNHQNLVELLMPVTVSNLTSIKTMFPSLDYTENHPDHLHQQQVLSKVNSK